ncbi:MAG: bacteriocin [Ramlibacter sp.]|nr:bacteriocin [Ramlibacter sp.]
MPTPTDIQTTNRHDPDLAEQARPGHGVPSQDPAREAQIPIDPAHAEVEERSVFVGAGVLAGAATGAAVGTAVAGPVGVVVGGTIGAVAGAIGGAAAGSLRPGEGQS